MKKNNIQLLTSTLALFVSLLLIALSLLLESHSSQVVTAETRITRLSEINIETIISTFYPDSVDYQEVVDVVEKTKKELELIPESISLDRFENKRNKDFLGSLFIPTLGITEPIYRDTGDYYLDHNYLGKSSSEGEIYLDSRASTDLISSGSLLNGHALANGNKFGKLKNLLSKKEAPSLYIWDYSSDKIYKYQLNFVNLIDGDESGIVMKFNSEEEQYYYYNQLYQEAIKKWSEVEKFGNFILLNTCSYIITDGHYLVVASMVGIISTVETPIGLN